jgi:hypothetical protein
MNFTKVLKNAPAPPTPSPPSVCALKPPSWALVHKITYAPMIYTALCIMFWMRAYPLLGQVGGGWALEISSFLGPKWHSPIGSMPFHRAQKTLLNSRAQPPKHYARGCVNHRCINSYNATIGFYNHFHKYCCYLGHVVLANPSAFLHGLVRYFAIYKVHFVTLV